MPTILLVEDNPGDAVLLEKAFDTVHPKGDVKIELRPTTDAALRTLSEQKSDLSLVLIDLKLAGIDGFGLLAALQSIEDLPPIAVLTSSGREDDRARARTLGVPDDSYFVKPMAIEGYRAIVRRLLEIMTTP